jgi:uncharacterized ion transporter superfamily protein YfcC
VVVDRIGSLGRLVGALVGGLRDRGLVAIPIIALFFATMGALENMQEEIIPLVPVLLVLGTGLGIDAVSVVAMSAGAAMNGSAFGPSTPFQAGIALQLAQLPVTTAGVLRLGMFVVAITLWIAWTMRHAAKMRTAMPEVTTAGRTPVSARDVLVLLLVAAPVVIYVYGSLKLGWGFNELSALFFVGGVLAGIVGGLGVGGTTTAYIEGMQSVISAAVLTMPVFVPLADLLHIPRLSVVLAYEMGAGLTELLTPTNGALMAVLVAAGVPYQRWLRFAIVGVAITLTVGVAGIIILLAG